MMMRDSKIDFLKGIGILLVVLGHSISTLTQPINQVILSFHMPLFFFCAGLTLKPIDAVNRKDFIVKKLKGIIGSQCIMGILAFLYDGIFLYLILHKIGNNELSIVAKGWFTQWFLPTLFMCDLLWVGINLLVKDLYSKSICVILVLITVTVGYIVGNSDINTILSIEKVPTALIFIILGFYTKAYLWDKVSILSLKKRGYATLLLIIGAICLVVLAWFNNPVEMYRNYYGCYGIFLITSILGILVNIILVVLVRKNKIIEMFGRNSLIVFVTHFTAVKCVSSVITNIFERINLQSFAPFVVFGIVVCGEIVVIYVFNEVIKRKGKR